MAGPIGVDIQGLPELEKALSGLTGPQMATALQKATLSGAGQIRKTVRAEAPVKTGTLRKSVSARKARGAERGYVVSPRPKVAFYRHFVVKGTKAHRIRFPNQVKWGVPRQLGNIRHPGAKANGFVSRGFDAGRPAAEKAVVKSIEKYVKKVWTA